jgi:flagellar biogenesis protein FliO
MNHRSSKIFWPVLGLFLFVTGQACAQTNTAPVIGQSLLPNATGSVFRVFGALIFVIGLFLGGVWLFKNWKKVSGHRGRAPKLNVLETRSLGGRQALYVVGYEQERYLIASSPTGVTLLTHLPAATAAETAGAAGEKSAATTPTFAQALSQVLKGK